MTALGRELRILRLKRGEILKDMAVKLGMTSSYLSAIECGKRNIPDDFISKLSCIYNLSRDESWKLEEAKARDKKEVKIIIPLDNLDEEQQEDVLKFARTFNDKYDFDLSGLIANLKRKHQEEEV